MIEKISWNNKVLWSYKISSTTECQHHDIFPMPNGNILILVWELKTKEEALKAGRISSLANKGLWSEKIIEIKPIGKDKAQLVWEWHAWNHLVQQNDSLLQNYGNVEKNRQLIHLNFSNTDDADFMHFNAITYNEDLDQLLISNRNYSEIFVLDHSTSTAEAAAHSGGRYHKGGDLLYRYGNPAAYNAGAIKDQVLFGQHSPNWIEKGKRDEGKILLFNNGQGRSGKEKNYSSVDLILPPMDEKGNYGSSEKTEYIKMYSEQETDLIGGNFFSPNVSSAQRLSNGNTLVCSGSTGQLCELNTNNEIVWLYINPITIRGAAERNTTAIGNQVFRCTFLEACYKGLRGKKLKSGIPLETGNVNYECLIPESKN